MLDSHIFADEIFGFHVQQATEKVLKAWLAALGEVYPFTHDLALLLQQLGQKGCEVSPFWDLVEYNVFAVQLRYDAVPGEDIPIDRKAALAHVQILYDRVASYLQSTS